MTTKSPPKSKSRILSNELQQQAVKEHQLAADSDRLKHGPDLLRAIEAVLLRFPHARLVRDGIGDAKYVIGIMGSQHVLGTGHSAQIAWRAALSSIQ